MAIQQVNFTPVQTQHHAFATTQGELEAEHRRKLQQIAAEANAKMRQAVMEQNAAAARMTSEHDQRTYEAGLAQRQREIENARQQAVDKANYDQTQLSNKNTLKQQGLTEARLGLQDKREMERDKTNAVKMGLDSSNQIERQSLDRDKFKAEQAQLQQQQDAKNKYFTLAGVGDFIDNSKANDGGYIPLSGAKDYLAVLGIPVEQINSYPSIYAQNQGGKIALIGADDKGKQNMLTTNDKPVFLNSNTLKLMQDSAAMDAGIKQGKGDRWTQYNREITDPVTGEVIGRQPEAFNTNTGQSNVLPNPALNNVKLPPPPTATDKQVSSATTSGLDQKAKQATDMDAAKKNVIPNQSSAEGMGAVSPLNKTSMAESGAAGLQRANEKVLAKNNVPVDPVPTGSNYSQSAWDELTPENKARVRGVNGYESQANGGIGGNVTASNNNGSAEFASFFGNADGGTGGSGDGGGGGGGGGAA